MADFKDCRAWVTIGSFNFCDVTLVWQLTVQLLNCYNRDHFAGAFITEITETTMVSSTKYIYELLLRLI